MAVASYFDTVQKLYIAFYQRPADPSGLYYWAQRMDVAGGSLEGMIDAFASSDEAVRLYDTNTDGKIDAADTSVLLDKVFQALFNRAPDAAGKQFYLDALTAGKFPDGRPATIGRVVLDVLNGANNADAVAVANKLEYATAFTKTLDPELDGIGPFTATYNGDDEAGARTLLAGVTADPTTRKTAAQVAGDVQTEIANAGDPILNQQTTGQTFTLTTGVDIKTGGTGNDTFDGSVNANGTATFTSVDQLNGGEGTDLLIGGINGQTVSAKLSNIENVELIDTVGSTFDLVNSTGVETLKVRNSSAQLTVTNIGSITAPAVTVENQTWGVNLQYTNAALVGANEVKVNLNGVVNTATNNADIALSQLAGSDTSGIETVTLNSVGSNQNFLDAVTAQNAAGTSTVTTLNVTGTQTLNIRTALAASVNTVSAADLAGGLSATFNNVGSNMMVTGGTGADAITLAANTGNVNITLGAGNDGVTFNGTSTFNTNDTVAGGEGTDTLSIKSAEAGAVTANLANVSGFERLTLNTAAAAESVNATRFGAIEQVNLAAAGNASLILTLDAGAKTVTVGNGTVGTASLATALTINDTGTATTDTLALNVTNSAGATDALGDVDLTINGFETITLNTGATVTAAQNLDDLAIAGDSTTGANTLNITGINTLNTTATVTSNSSGLFTINASGMTGNAALVMTAAPTFTGGVTGTVSITGTANADTLIGHASASSTINGGAGIDNITGGTGADSLVGGAGNDIITAGGGNDTVSGDAGDDTITAAAGTVNVDGGAGNDVVNMGATLTAGDVVNGGEGTDTLALGAGVLAGVAAGVSGFEIFRFDTAVQTQDLVQFTGNTTFTTLQANHGVGLATFNNTGAGVTNFASLVTAASATITRLVDTTSNALSVAGNDTTTGNDGVITIAALTVNDEETLNIRSGTDAGEDLTITTLNASDLTTLNLSGNADVIITNAIVGSANLATVSAAAVQGAVTVNAAASTANMTFNGSLSGTNVLTGGTGADTITGGTVADTIVGGNGADNVSGNAGNDVLLGGIGADVINGGIGDDTIIGGAGNDTLTGDVGADVFGLQASNGVDTITGFVSATDDISLGAVAVAQNALSPATALVTLSGALSGQEIAAGAGAANSVTIAVADDYLIFNLNGAAANFTTAGTATLTAADLTATTLTALAAYLDERVVTANAADEALIAINWTAGGSTQTYLYRFNDAAGDTAVDAGELTLVGVVDRGTTALVAGDFIA